MQFNAFVDLAYAKTLRREVASNATDQRGRGRGGGGGTATCQEGAQVMRREGRGRDFTAGNFRTNRGCAPRNIAERYVEGGGGMGAEDGGGKIQSTGRCTGRDTKGARIGVGIEVALTHPYA